MLLGEEWRDNAWGSSREWLLYIFLSFLLIYTLTEQYQICCAPANSVEVQAILQDRGLKRLVLNAPHNGFKRR